MSALAEVWTGFADLACGRYSPIYDRVSRCVADSEDVLALVAEAPPQSHMPTVLLACVHFLLLGGVEEELAYVYSGASSADPGPLFVRFCLEHGDELLELMAYRHTNTNEVGRSAILGPAITAAAHRAGSPSGPVALVDVGCSAGLNLLCDRYRLEYPGRGFTGPPDSDVRIECDVVGGKPPLASTLPDIVHRVGIDLDPVDLSDDDEFRWQLACVWPDTGRLPRTRRAMELARADQPRIVAGDAVERVPEVLSGLPLDALAVVVTTWAMAYLTVEARVAFVEALTAVATSARRPVAWISGEDAGVVPAFSGIEAPVDEHGMKASIVGLMVFEPSGHPGAGAAAAVHSELLAFGHPHGKWIDWQAD